MEILALTRALARRDARYPSASARSAIRPIAGTPRLERAQNSFLKLIDAQAVALALPVARLAGGMALLGAVAVEAIRDLAQPAPALTTRDARGTNADASERPRVRGLRTENRVPNLMS